MAECCRRHGRDTRVQLREAASIASSRHLGRALAAATLVFIILGCGRGPDKAGAGGSDQNQSTGGTYGETGGAAAGGSASDPFATAERCTSGKSWTSGEGSTMRPGEACISCHSTSGGPRLAVAGTVYPTAHEPDDCNGAGEAGAVVVITDSNAQEHALLVNEAGNFTLSGVLAVPYSARVVVGAAQRSMGSSQSTGDCNGCHTQSGSNGAPGRIVLPL